MNMPVCKKPRLRKIHWFTARAAAFLSGRKSEEAQFLLIYYGQKVSVNGILFAHQVAPSPAENQLISKISEYSR
jgi:hypothetical protein